LFINSTNNLLVKLTFIRIGEIRDRLIIVCSLACHATEKDRNDSPKSWLPLDVFLSMLTFHLWWLISIWVDYDSRISVTLVENTKDPLNQKKI